MPETTQPPRTPRCCGSRDSSTDSTPWRERRARKRGLQPTVTPFPGYAGVDWVRVLGRVLIVPPVRQRTSGEYASVRGWRSFAAVPVGFAQVSITIAGVTHEVVADRGGVIDTVLAGPPRARLADPHDVGRRRRARRDPRLRRRTGCAIRRRLRHRRHRHGDHDPPPAAGGVELVRRRRARPSAGSRHGRAHGAAGARSCRAPPSSTSRRAPGTSRRPSSGSCAATSSRPGAMLLTDWGPTHDRWFRSGKDHKLSNLRRIATEFPHVKWLLIGDDGQHDDELYTTFTSENPRQRRRRRHPPPLPRRSRARRRPHRRQRPLGGRQCRGSPSPTARDSWSASKRSASSSPDAARRRRPRVG